jgi:hypothetical protein
MLAWHMQPRRSSPAAGYELYGQGFGSIEYRRTLTTAGGLGPLLLQLRQLVPRQQRRHLGVAGLHSEQFGATYTASVEKSKPGFARLWAEAHSCTLYWLQQQIGRTCVQCFLLALSRRSVANR